MNIIEHLQSLFPDAYEVELERWAAGGREYAAKLDKLPAPEQEAVAQLFACHGMSRSAEDRRAYRAAIDVVIKPWYPRAGGSHERSAR